MQELIDDVVPEVLPAMKRKGLQLLINNALPAGEQRYGDREALRRTLVLLIQYSVTTTLSARSPSTSVRMSRPAIA